MENSCASCGKAVYSMELLKCIDQTWHRICFKCQTCGMTLNVKNYKAYHKKPYCNVHYPQSNSYTFVTDNQEIQRVKQNTAVISPVSYAGRKGSTIPTDSSAAVVVNRRFSEIPPQTEQQILRPHQLQTQSSYQRGSINDFDPEAHNTADRGLDPNAGRRGSTIFASTAMPFRSESRTEAVTPQDGEKSVVPEVNPEAKLDEGPKPRAVVSEAKSEMVPPPPPVVPEANPEEVPPPQPEAKPEEVPPPQPEAKPEEVPPPQPEAKPEEVPPPQPEAKPEEVPPPPPVVPEAKPEELPPQQPEIKPEEITQQAAVTAPLIAAKPTASAKRNRGRCYKAQFGYAARDSDEVSFNAGEIITNGDPIDSGWMYGLVERTGQYGLLPANYVIEEVAQAF